MARLCIVRIMSVLTHILLVVAAVWSISMGIATTQGHCSSQTETSQCDHWSSLVLRLDIFDVLILLFVLVLEVTLHDDTLYQVPWRCSHIICGSISTSLTAAGTMAYGIIVHSYDLEIVLNPVQSALVTVNYAIAVVGIPAALILAICCALLIHREQDRMLLPFMQA